MAITRLGWDVFTSASNPRLTNSTWITGKVRGGDHKVVLDELCRRFDAEVENIRQDWSWGYNYRPVRGATVISEHAAGTAVDLNAPKHPLGKVGTFSSAEVSRIHRILADLDNAVRWGGDYAGRKDEMHFELQGGNALMKRVADKIRGGVVVPVGNVKPRPKPKPKPKGQPDDYADLRIDGDFGPVTVKAVQILMRAIKTYTRAVDGDWGRYTKIAVQEWLKGLGYYNRAVDGDFGKQSVIALQRFLAAKHRYSGRIDGDFGPMTVKALQAYLNSQNGR